MLSLIMYIGKIMNLHSTKILRNLVFLIFVSMLIFSCTKKEDDISTEKIDKGSNKPVRVVSGDKLKEKDGIMYEYMKSIPFTGRSEKYTKDSLLYQEKTYKLGRLNGNMTFRYSNGQKEFELYWLSGKKHGESFKWAKDGQLLMEEHYQHGKFHGTNKEWYENGKLKASVHFKEGKNHRKAEYYYENGQISI
ncbi:MAG: hypothetical protein GQ534_00830, partial [Candidatus Delongbacteria bacterium]|nr:hypothetical protein [Candidatus Delongbacteria bacterium]